MSKILRNALLAAGILIAGQAAAQVTFYANEGLRGETLTADSQVRDLANYGFDNRAASAIVQNGRWEACSEPYYRGRCVILVPGQYRTLADLNMNFQVSSVRPLDSAPVARSYTVPPAAYSNDDSYREGYRAGRRDREEEHHWWHHHDDD
jgi:hypothetical protein